MGWYTRFSTVAALSATARAVKVGLVGFVLVSVSAKWTFLGERPTGRTWEAAAVAMFFRHRSAGYATTWSASGSRSYSSVIGR